MINICVVTGIKPFRTNCYWKLIGFTPPPSPVFSPLLNKLCLTNINKNINVNGSEEGTYSLFSYRNLLPIITDYFMIHQIGIN